MALNLFLLLSRYKHLSFFVCAKLKVKAVSKMETAASDEPKTGVVSTNSDEDEKEKLKNEELVIKAIFSSPTF